MLRRRSNQKTFFDEIVGYYLPDNHFLKVNNIIDWTPIEKRLENLYDPSWGRPSYPPLIMFKALLLQQWFNLSERDLSEAITDNLSFKSFLGLSLSDPVPDDTTFCRFRQKLQEEGLLEKLFSLLDGQFEDLGILVKKGSFIDGCNYCSSSKKASFKRDKASKEAKKEEKEEAENGDKGFTGNIEGGRQNKDQGFIGITRNGKIYYKSDPDARWTVKRGKFPYGYNVHVNADESGIARRLEMTPANVHDSSRQ